MMAKKLLTQIKLSLLMLFYLQLGSCHNDEANYCEFLEQKVQDEEIQAYLIEWVNDNVVEDVVNSDALHMGAGIWPGEYELRVEFDWEVLGFSAGSQVRLVTDPGKNVFKNTLSVLFAERSRAGILVQFSEEKGFGINAQDLRSVSEKIAVVCSI